MEQQILIGLLIGIICLIFMIIKTKIHTFLALIIATIIVGIVGGMEYPQKVTKKVGIKGLDIVSNNVQGYANAIGLLGDQYSGYLDEFTRSYPDLPLRRVIQQKAPKGQGKAKLTPKKTVNPFAPTQRLSPRGAPTQRLSPSRAPLKTSPRTTLGTLGTLAPVAGSSPRRSVLGTRQTSFVGAPTGLQQRQLLTPSGRSRTGSF